jgi:hypothetical protein
LGVAGGVAVSEPSPSSTTSVSPSHRWPFACEKIAFSTASKPGASARYAKCSTRSTCGRGAAVFARVAPVFGEAVFSCEDAFSWEAAFFAGAAFFFVGAFFGAAGFFFEAGLTSAIFSST